MFQQFESREAITLENNGQKFFAILHRPINTDSPVPAIVICPGFAGSKSGKFRLFVRLSEQLVKNGIAVLRFDYRGSGDSEGDFSDVTIESKISDTLKCLEFLSNDSKIDASRIGILGRSLGGVITILTVRRFPKIKSLALWAPVFKSDPWKALWEAFKSNQLNLSHEQMIRALPANVPNVEFLTQFFKFNLNHELPELKHIPILLLHGSQDQLVTVEHAQAFEKAREGIEHSRFIYLPKGDHDFSDSEEQKIVIEETVKWFVNTL